MGDTPQTSSDVVLATVYRDDFVKQINRKATTLSLLPKRPAVNKAALLAIQTSGHLAAEVAEGAEITDFGSDSQVPVSLALANEVSSYRVTDKAAAAGAAVGNPTGVSNLHVKNMVDSTGALAKFINGKLFTGTGIGTTEAIIGLGVWLDDSNTVGTLDRSSATYWQSNVIDNASVAVTRRTITDALATVRNACGMRPDLGVCNPLGFSVIEDIFQQQRRYVLASDVLGTPVFGEPEIAIMNINGCVIVEDDDGYAGDNNFSLYLLNMSHVWLEVLRQQEQAPGFEAMGIQAHDGFDVFDVGFCYQPLAKTGLSQKGLVSWMGQLVIDRPNTCGIVTNLLY